jgi:RNA polymerase sigma factor (sigma-70 family)
VTRRSSPRERALDELVHAARDGDEHAWSDIVERYTGLLWSVVRAHGLGPAAAADVVQTTWLRLCESLSGIREPKALGEWLVVTARRECLREINRNRRVELRDDPDVFEADAEHADPAERSLLRDSDHTLRAALQSISERCQALLRLLASPAEPSYEEISVALSIPIGSIGPTRARCLEHLRKAYLAAGGAP